MPESRTKVYIDRIKLAVKDMLISLESVDTSETTAEGLEEIQGELSTCIDKLQDNLTNVEDDIKTLEDEESQEENDVSPEEEPSIMEEHYGEETKEETETFTNEEEPSDGEPDRKFDLE